MVKPPGLIILSVRAYSERSCTTQKCRGICLRPLYDLDLSAPFSVGEVPAARTFMNLFSVSNQKGAPREAAIAVRIQPTRWPGTTAHSHGNATPLSSRTPGNALLFQAATNLGFALALACSSDSALQSASVRPAPRRV